MGNHSSKVSEQSEFPLEKQKLETVYKMSETPTVSSRISQELVSFYAQLGWDEKTRREFLASSLGSLNQVELITLLEQEIGDFLEKCHPLLLALSNSIQRGGRHVQ